MKLIYTFQYLFISLTQIKSSRNASIVFTTVPLRWCCFTNYSLWWVYPSYNTRLGVSSLVWLCVNTYSLSHMWSTLSLAMSENRSLISMGYKYRLWTWLYFQGHVLFHSHPPPTHTHTPQMTVHRWLWQVQHVLRRIRCVLCLSHLSPPLEMLGVFFYARMDTGGLSVVTLQSFGMRKTHKWLAEMLVLVEVLIQY